MNREDVIRMALQCGIFHEYDSEGQWDGLTNEALGGKDWLSSKEHKLNRMAEILTPFAELVAAAEREACAKVCEHKAERIGWPTERWPADNCAAAIRARKEK